MRQRAKDAGKFEEVRRLSKDIQITIRRDRRDFYNRNFENELWHDIKMAKSSYLPKYTRIRDKDGGIASSDRRPDILAD